MTVWCYIYSIAKRAETIALVDSRVTENFPNLSYAQWLQLSIKRLLQPQKLYNMDRTENKARQLQYYMDLQVQTGGTKTLLQFFLANLGDSKAILEYSWFTATQPWINWKKGWIDHMQLPIILQANNAKQAIFVPRIWKEARRPLKDQYYIRSVIVYRTKKKPKPEVQIPHEYQ
jgi:hypothetical protein